MKILQIATPYCPVFAVYAVQNKKKVWIIERQPVLFFGLVEALKGEETVEPLVYNYQKEGMSVATSYQNFLGLDILAQLHQPIKDFSKELIVKIAELENPPASNQNSVGVLTPNNQASV